MKIEFGTEVFVTSKRYKISDKKLKELKEEYGHCLSNNQVSELRYSEENYDNIVLKLEDLVEFDSRTNPCVVIANNYPFNHYYVKAHKGWNLSNICIYPKENLNQQYNFSKVGIEFKDIIIHLELLYLWYK